MRSRLLWNELVLSKSATLFPFYLSMRLLSSPAISPGLPRLSMRARPLTVPWAKGGHGGKARNGRGRPVTDFDPQSSESKGICLVTDRRSSRCMGWPGIPSMTLHPTCVFTLCMIRRLIVYRNPFSPLQELIQVTRSKSFSQPVC